MLRPTITSSTLKSLLVVLALLCGPVTPAIGQVLTINLWPDGLVPYRYCSDDPDCDPDLELGGSEATLTGEKGDLRAMMTLWETELTAPDPNSGRLRQYVRFENCEDDCTGPYVLIRRNDDEDGNMCSYDRTSNTGEKLGWNPDGPTILHFRSRQEPRIMLHELGHCLGLWHEFNRKDADRWLVETPDEDGARFADVFNTRAGLMPVVGNYDYDSIVHYRSGGIDGGPDFLDAHENRFSKSLQGAAVSARDKSRLLQYYANERYPGWGFFMPLHLEPLNPDALPNPYLPNGIEAVGTPAIAHQSPGNFDLFARGSDNCIYWKMRRQVGNAPPVGSHWSSIGCHFRSDPSAVSRALNRIDVVAINSDGDVQRIKYIDGVWAAPLTIRGGHPVVGLKHSTDVDYIGPAIASRGADLLDVFVVDADGLLAVTTWANGNWGAWQTLAGQYNVTARPAAVAMSATDVRLAINASSNRLYEPLVTFGAGAPVFVRGNRSGTTADQAPPTLTVRNGVVDNYRVLITNPQGRISHRFASGTWMDIGGIPKPGTGISAVATGNFTFMAIMNGEDAIGCSLSCPTVTAEAPMGGGQVIQPGGLWIRYFQ